MDANLQARCSKYRFWGSESFLADQKHLYLQNMYKYDYATGPYLTSFAIKINMFLSFFGTDILTDTDTAMGPVVVGSKYLYLAQRASSNWPRM
jgi:hypothetical protein